MPRGFHSLAVKAHHPPQASLACVPAARPARKRRQPVLKPCDRAPKLLCRWSLRRIGYGGSTEAPRKVGCRGPAGVREQGKGTGGASQEPGRSLYSQWGSVLGRRTANPGARRQEATLVPVRANPRVPREPSDESISCWVGVKGSRSVLSYCRTWDTPPGGPREGKETPCW